MKTHKNQQVLYSLKRNRDEKTWHGSENFFREVTGNGESDYLRKTHQFKRLSIKSCSVDLNDILSDNSVTFSFKTKSTIPLMFPFDFSNHFAGQKNLHFYSPCYV